MLRVFRTLLFLIATISLLVTSLSCHRTPIEPEKIKANLIYEDALCTEAYLRLKLAYIDFPANVDLYVDKNKVNSFRTFSEDTVIMVENLLPKKSYTSYVRIYPAGGGEIVSNEVSFTTMDTTSHNFTWQIFEFGECSNSVLYDVAIIDENNIWAVGEIYLRDSLGRCDPNAYNAVHWDGTKWELKRITVNFRGSLITPPIEGVFAFSSTDIWFVGSLPIHGNGTNWQMYDLRTTVDPNLSVSKAWGTSSSDMYFVGRKGNIAHWDGRSWKKIESGTTISLLDIWGTSNGMEVWTCGWNANTGENILLRRQSSHWQKIPLPNYISDTELLGTLWMYGNSEVIISGSGDIFRLSIFNLNLIRRVPVNLGAYAYRIRGVLRNDISLVGDFSMVWHWNGVSWHMYNELYNFDDRLYGLAVSPTMIVAVGTRIINMVERKGLVLVGKR